MQDFTRQELFIFTEDEKPWELVNDYSVFCGAEMGLLINALIRAALFL